MIRIAVVDDEPNQAERTAEYVREYMKSKNADAIIEIYSNGTELAKTSTVARHAKSEKRKNAE